jgi:hypothetical protein
MSNYYPDKWVIVKFTTPTETYYKCLGGWFGGFAWGDSWRMNSGIDYIKETDDSYEVYGHSGSMYDCVKVREGMSFYMESVYNSYLKEAESLEEYSLQIVKSDSDEFKGLLKND